MYIEKGQRYRPVATRQSIASDVHLTGELWGSLPGHEIHPQFMGHRFAVFEQTTHVVAPTFVVVDLDVLGIEPTGEFLPEIIETFYDRDSAIMALRMMK